MILGIDLGKRTTGLAISEGQLASPHTTIYHKSSKEALEKILKMCLDLEVDKIVLGYVEGKIKDFFVNFASKIKKAQPQIEVVLWDETLTSRQAAQSMIKLGFAKKKRRAKEHETAAALILQSYLDSNE